jgi:hypothetical protein
MTTQPTPDARGSNGDRRQTQRPATDLAVAREQEVGRPAAHQVWPAPLSLGPTVPLRTTPPPMNTAPAVAPADSSAETSSAADSDATETAAELAEPTEQAGAHVGKAGRGGAVASWPLCLLALPAGVAAWSGWVGLGQMTGFGRVHPLPGLVDSLEINTAITLPVGVEAYAAYAMSVWLGQRRVTSRTSGFARYSALGALVLGGFGQVAYHLLENAHAAKVAKIAHDTGRSVADVAKQLPAQAPWWITTAVACLPVIVLGLAAALAHMVRHDAHSDAANKPGNAANPTTATNATKGANTAVTGRANTVPPVAAPVTGDGRANMGRQEAADRPAPVPLANGRRNSTPPKGHRKRGMFREQMRDFWDSEIAYGRIPSGADLNRAAGRDPGYSLGKKYAQQWRAELPAGTGGENQ